MDGPKPRKCFWVAVDVQARCSSKHQQLSGANRLSAGEIVQTEQHYREPSAVEALLLEPCNIRSQAAKISSKLVDAVPISDVVMNSIRIDFQPHEVALLPEKVHDVTILLQLLQISARRFSMAVVGSHHCAQLEKSRNEKQSDCRLLRESS